MALISEHDDRALVELFHAGDDGAFRSIVERHHRSLYANALQRLRNPAHAEDAVQDTLLKAYRALPRFNGQYRLDAWLHRILTNVCTDMGRKRGRDLRMVDKVSAGAETLAPAADDGLDLLDEGEVNDALQSLPDRYREAMVLRFIDELDYSDVAAKAGISEQNARARVSRGRTMMRRMLDGMSGLFILLIPRLRKTDLSQAVLQPDSANAVAHATGIVAHAAPAVAQMTPAVQGSAPVLGKAAVAIGLAASVAIPTSVAVDSSRTASPLPKAAPPAEAEFEVAVPAPAAPPTTASPTVSAVSSTVPQSFAGGVANTVPETTLPPPTTTTTTTLPPTTTTTVAPTTSTAPPTTVAMEPGPPGTLAADALAVTRAGPRTEVSGPFTLVVDGVEHVGTLAGKLLVEDDGTLDGTVTYSFDDGTSLELRLKGTVDGDTVAAAFRMPGAGAYGLEEAGDLTGSLQADGDTGSLRLSLPGALRPAA